MIITIQEERLIVVSDVHLGNALFNAWRPFIEFLKFVRQNGYHLCINGDGIDIVQTTLSRLSRDLPECSGALRKFAHEGLRVYYTVGNHDIILEHFLDDWGIVRVAPFLNLYSGDSRIRIEHGHLYDEAYLRFPRLYNAATVLGRVALKIHPRVYKAMEGTRAMAEKLGRKAKRRAAQQPADDGETIPNEPLMFRERASEISRHGFDAVIFGHTHCYGQVQLDTGATYINTGCWFFEPHYAEINQGQVALKRVADCGSEIAELVELCAPAVPTF
jgi:UDP-2,3-diacylglucosamine pyrophosphatase LpxH